MAVALLRFQGIPAEEESRVRRLIRIGILVVWRGLIELFRNKPEIYRSRRRRPPYPGWHNSDPDDLIPDSFPNQARHWLKKEQVNEEYLYELKGPCRIEPLGGWVIRPRYSVWRESIPPDAELELPNLERSLHAESRLRLPAVFLLRNPRDTHHRHFLNDILGRIALFDRLEVPSDIPFVISKRLSEYPLWQECFAMAQFKERSWVIQDDTTIIETGKVYFGKPALYDRETLEDVMDFLHAPQPPSPSTPGHRLFLTRRDNRTLVNLGEIEHLAVRYGLTIVDPGQWSLREQIEIFSQTELVVGPYGSAFDNIMFRRGGSLKVLELFSSRFTPPFHYWLCASFGYQYHVLGNGEEIEKESEALDRRRHPQQYQPQSANFYIDPDRFVAALKPLLK